MMPLHRRLALLVPLLLAACMGPAPSASVPSPSVPPPVAPTPSVAVPSAPTPERGALFVLPTPLIFINASDGQLWRMERDGQSLTQITFESTPLLAYDLAADGALVYLLEGNSQKIVVLVEQGERREMLYGDLEHPIFEPSGEQILVRINDPEPGLIIGQASAPPGVYGQFHTGGRPSLVLADRPQAAPAGSVQFSPFAYAPNGTNLLLHVRDGTSQLPQLGIFDPAMGDVLRLPCCAYSWSPDQTTLYTAGPGTGADSSAQIVQVSAAGGAPRTLGPGFSAIGPLVAAADGSLLLFAVPSDSSLAPEEPAFVMQRIAADGTVVTLREERYALRDAAWAADASGAVVEIGNAGATRWVPVDPAAPVVELAAKGTALRFATNP